MAGSSFFIDGTRIYNRIQCQPKYHKNMKNIISQIKKYFVMIIKDDKTEIFLNQIFIEIIA